jgi:glycosyltransferase involved in cell wall biosynthesis
MNNNFFILTRYLRDFGYDAHLFYFDENDHFFPHNDTFSLDYQNYSTLLTWRGLYDSVEEIRQQLKGFDLIIGCGVAPRLCELAGIKMHIMYPYGGDIYNVMLYEGNIKKEILFHYVKSRLKKYFGINVKWHENDYRYAMEILYQLNGIKKADYIISPRTNDEFDYFFDKFDLRNKLINNTFPLLYKPLYDQDTIKEFFHRSHWFEEFKKIREDNDLIVFHHTRHIWKTPKNPFENKANDRLIRAFAKFVSVRKDIKPKLILMEYSRDFTHSRRLIKELGIEKYVQWFPKLPRKEIMIGISMCDVGATEFENSWISGGVISEFLAMKKIFIGYRNDELYFPYFDSLYPILNARTEEDIYQRLVEFADNSKYYEMLGSEAYNWFVEHLIDSPLRTIKDIISKYQ